MLENREKQNGKGEIDKSYNSRLDHILHSIYILITNVYYLRNKFEAEPIAIISLIITFLFGGATVWLNWHVFESSKSTKLEFVCNDASNSNGYIAKDETYLLIEVQCKIRHLGSKNVSIDSYGGVYYLNNESYSNKGYLIEDRIII